MIDIKNFLPQQETANEKPEQVNVSEVQQSQTTNQRKKRFFLPLSIDDYEKRRSARSVNKILDHN